MEDKSRSQSSQIAEVHDAESRMRLRPHLVKGIKFAFKRVAEFRRENKLTATIEECMRCKHGEGTAENN